MTGLKFFLLPHYVKNIYLLEDFNQMAISFGVSYDEQYFLLYSQHDALNHDAISSWSSYVSSSKKRYTNHIVKVIRDFCVHMFTVDPTRM